MLDVGKVSLLHSEHLKWKIGLELSTAKEVFLPGKLT